MIAYIKGKLTDIQEESVIVDVQGVGYEIICANPYDFQNSLQQDVFIHTYHHVRDDIQCLYGFKNRDEKYLFTKLISVSGIGPKSGITIQGSVRVPEFVAAVEREDEKYLTQFPGVGKKTARQIILDLKGKLVKELHLSPVEVNVQEPQNDQQIYEAMEALRALGYSEGEISKITPKLHTTKDISVDGLIKKALALLVKS